MRSAQGSPPSTSKINCCPDSLPQRPANSHPGLHQRTYTSSSQATSTLDYAYIVMAASENDVREDTGSGVQVLPPSVHAKYIALPLPLSPHTTFHIRITHLETSNMIFLTTTDYSASAGTSALGSFVYAMPNVSHPSFPEIASIASNEYGYTALKPIRRFQHSPVPCPKQYRLRDPSCQNLGPENRETYICWMQCYFSGGYGGRGT